MNRLVMTLTALLFTTYGYAGAPAAPAANSAPQQGAPGMAPMGMPASHMDGRMGPGGGLAKMLELTPEQEKKLEALTEENQKALLPFQQEYATAMRALIYAANDPKESDSIISEKLATMKAKKKALAAQQEQNIEKINAILNVRQQAKISMLLDRPAMPRGPMGGMGMQHPQMGGGAPGAPGMSAPGAGAQKSPAPGK